MCFDIFLGLCLLKEYTKYENSNKKYFMTKSILAQALFEAQISDESVYSFTILLEDRLNFIKDRYKGALDSVVDTIASTVDPSKNKKYTEWLVDRHLKGDNVLEPKVKSSLELFDKANSTAHDTNIKNHTIESLHDTAHMIATSNKMKPRDSLIPLYEKDGVKGYEIPNKETSVSIYGPAGKTPTRWCTAAASQTNAYDSYDGGKYTMHFPNGHFLQIHHDSGQAKDPQNTEIDFHTDDRYKEYTEHINSFMHQTAKRDLVGADLPEKHFGIEKEKFDHFFDLAKNHDDHEKFRDHLSNQKLSDEQFDFAQNKIYSKNLEGNPHLKDDQIDTIVSKYSSPHSTSLPSNSFLSNPNLKPHHVDAIVDAIAKKPEYLSRVARIKNLEPRHIDRFFDNSNVISNIISHGHKLTDDQLDRLPRDHQGLDLLVDASLNQKLPEHHRQHVAKVLINDGWQSNIANFSKNNKFNDNELNSLIDSPIDKNTLLDLPNLKPEHTDRILRKLENQKFPADFIANEKIPHSFVEKILTSNKTPSGGERNIRHNEIDEYTNRRDAQASTVLTAAKNADLYDPEGDNERDIDALRKHTNFYKTKDMPEEVIKNPLHSVSLLSHLNYHPKLTKENLHSIVDGAISKDYMRGLHINRLLDHSNVNPSHIKKILSHPTFAEDKAIRDSINEHPRTPPSLRNV